MVVMKRFAPVVLVALAAASSASAKGGAQAHLLRPLPTRATPGMLITVRWKVDVPGESGYRVGLSAVGMFVAPRRARRCFDRRGGERERRAALQRSDSCPQG